MIQSLSQPTAPGERPGRERLWRRLDPRRHIAAAVGWSVFAVVLVGTLLAAELAAYQAGRRMRADTQAQLSQTAGQTADALLAQVHVRLAAMQAAVAQWQLDASADKVAADRLRALQRTQPELSWLGLLDDSGQPLASTDSGAAAALAGQSWLLQAARAPVVALHRSHDANVSDALVLAVPLAPPDAPPAGTLVAHLPWLWLQAQLDARLRAMVGGAPIEVLLLDPAGRLLAGPPQVREHPPGADLSEGGRYLVGRPPHGADAAVQPDGAGWQVVVREQTGKALAGARQTRRAVLLAVLLVGLAAALAAAVVAHRLLGRLGGLAEQARAVQRGGRSAIAAPPGRDEVQAIGAALAQLVDHLQAEKAALARLNAELDARVAERTGRIERLARDARRAAVTRERLRLARALHDTLAHSLMGLLTQLRMVRKLSARWSPEQLDAELAGAEQAAAAGLAEARGAIVHMRQTSVRDSGLAAALQALAARFGARTGVSVQTSIDPAAAGLADERAATVLRIAREALRNVERHADAGRITLSLAPERGAEGAPERHWRLELADDGAGFDLAAPHAGHFGLTGMRERAEQLGAELRLDSAPGRGTRLVLRFTP